MRFSLKSVQLGPWVCELAIDGYHPHHSARKYEQVDIARMTYDIIVRCPNVRALYLGNMVVGYGFYAKGVIDQPGELTRLENLWLNGFRGRRSEGFSDGLWT